MTRATIATAAILGAVLTVGAVAVILLSLESDESSPEIVVPEWAKRYPELDAVSPALRDQIRAALPADATYMMPFDCTYQEHLERRKRLLALLEDLRSEREKGPRAILAVLLETHGVRAPGVCASLPAADHGPCPIGTWLRERPTEALDGILLRLAVDRDVSDWVRLNAVIALCREGNVAVVGPLASIVRDSSEEVSTREAVLDRLPLIGAPLSEDLGDLLWLPFESLDRPVAAAIAWGGEMLAPSLIRDGLIEGHGYCERFSYAAARGILASEIMDESLRRPAGEIVRLLGPGAWNPEGGRSAERGDPENASRELGEALDAWLSSEPEAIQSEYERARREYRTSPRRSRERAVRNLRELVLADDEDLDLAACSLMLEPVAPDQREAYVSVHLAKLDRLARLVKREIAGLVDPEAIIAVLNRRLLNNCEPSISPAGIADPFSRLGTVLRHRRGNDLGLSLLYLAVADRLGLPIRPVLAPEYVLVRWDHGTLRRNIETAEDGAAVTDDELMARHGIHPEEVRAERFLVPVAPKRLLSRQVCRMTGRRSSFAWIGDESDGNRQVRIADIALQLDPENEEAYAKRAYGRDWDDPVEVESSLEDIRAALELRPESSRFHTIEAGLLAAIEKTEKALVSYAEAIRLDSGNRSAHLGRIRLLKREHRWEDASAACEAALEAVPDDDGVRQNRMYAWIALGREGWRRELADLVEDPVDGPALHFEVARILLESETDRPADPEAALTVLDRVRGLMDLPGEEEEEETKNDGSLAGEMAREITRTAIPEGWVTGRALVAQRQRRYLELRIAALTALDRGSEVDAAQRRLDELDGAQLQVD